MSEDIMGIGPNYVYTLTIVGVQTVKTTGVTGRQHDAEAECMRYASGMLTDEAFATVEEGPKAGRVIAKAVHDYGAVGGSRLVIGEGKYGEEGVVS